MVFHGFPSRDCAPCRRRKTRCDLVPEGCSQCRRAKITCYGYRSPNELLFRDARKTVQKAAALQTASRLPSAPKFTSDTSARHAFLFIYIGTYSCGFSTPLQTLLAESGPSRHLETCVDAVGLAFLAFQLNRRDLIPLANQHYLKAVQRLRTVVGSSTQVDNSAANRSLSDVTLQSILLLDLYEKMSYQYSRLSEYPSLPLSHIQAALSILQSRPRAEFTNPTTQQLASRTVYALTLSCGGAGMPIPVALIRLYNDLDSSMSGPLWILVGLFIRLVDFHAAARAGKLSRSEVLERARDFHGDISLAQSRIPHSWRPHRKYTNGALVFDGYYDVYPRHDATQVLNTYRILRLGICAILQKFQPSTAVAEEIRQITHEICATVPHIILPTARPQNTFPLSPLQILECSALLTALYAAAQNTQDPVMRAWILQTLMYMADNGVKTAQTVAYIITFLSETHQWNVFSIAGNYAILG